VSETRRDEQKLWLILFQIKGVRSRLNFLALQRWLFAGLAILIGAVGLTFFAAASFGPLTFLGIGIFLLMAAIVGIVHETVVIRAMRTSPAQAAAIADAQSQMKGRLTTVLALAPTPKRSPLWAYLVEDTYGRREEFEPSRITPRWLSRALYPLLASILLAALALPAARLSSAPRRSPAAPGVGGPNQITADIRNLDIRPADPALRPNAEIYADPETLRKLADKLAAAENSDRNRRGLSKLVDKARSFADAFQNKLNGLDRAHSNPTRMRLTDRNPGPSNKPKEDDANPGISGNANGGSGLADNSQRGAAGTSQLGAAQSSPPPITSLPPEQADELAAKNPSTTAPASAQAPSGNETPANAGDPNTGGGSNHGSGSDPASLYGPGSAQPLGSDSFKIAIEAEPSNESSSPGSPTYVPPRIRVPLNSNQYPDQPLARAAVPAADQNTIKRVFAR
jgi:hypothetical protein